MHVDTNISHINDYTPLRGSARPVLENTWERVRGFAATVHSDCNGNHRQDDKTIERFVLTRDAIYSLYFVDIHRNCCPKPASTHSRHSNHLTGFLALSNSASPLRKVVSMWLSPVTYMSLLYLLPNFVESSPAAQL
jgi:hypothetical protein